MHRKLPPERIADLRGRDGLRSVEVEARRKAFGQNDILEVAGNAWRELAEDTAKDPMIWFLLATALVYLVLGSRVEALTLFAAVAPLVGMDAFLHRRTQASTAGLRVHLAGHATVHRDDRWIEVPAVELVPGDLVRVESGGSFPADGVLTSVRDLQVDESALTGEAYPVRKRALDPYPEGGAAHTATEPEDAHWGFAGTRALAGSATARIVFTGGDTLYGEIVASAVRGDKAATPLQAAIANLVALLVSGAAALCGILAFVRLRQGHGWLDAIVSAATLAVAALPEEFPVVFTVFLGVGVYRLAKRKALVRRAVSVENIGRVSCICSDKTGTITEGRLRLSRMIPVEGQSESSLLRLAALASRSETGDPLDVAVHENASARGIAVGSSDRAATFPFTESRRRETAVLLGDGEPMAITKGSPETVLALCRMSGADSASWLEKTRALAGEGQKVLACATRSLDAGWMGGEPDRDFRLEGLLAFEDPVRKGVKEAIDSCRDGGIRVILVTGDHPATARAVAGKLGLGGSSPRVVTGEELVPEGEAGGVRLDLRSVDVIARALPSQKLALVQALRSQGEIVAVTGDGVNDVPALQAADIGIAMGQRGTRSAREVSSIVLLDDDFSSIVHAIAEGRQLFRNLQLSFQYLLMIHIPLVLTATLIPLAGYPLLYLPIHVVWLEAIIHPTALLVFQELPHGNELLRAPPRREGRFFSMGDWLLIGVVGLLMTVLVAASYDRSLGAGGDVEHARAMALTVLILASAAITAISSRLRSVSAAVVAGATLLSALSLVQIPWTAHLLHLEPLHLDDWAIAIAGVGAAVGVPFLVRGLAGASGSAAIPR
jgi:P-type Ca2+ transporter type 2C